MSKGKQGFQPGHAPHHMPKGHYTRLKKAASNLSVAIQNRVGVEVMHEWWVIVMKGRHYPMLIEECGNCDHWDHSHPGEKVTELGPCNECDCDEFEQGLLRVVPDPDSPSPRPEDRARAADTLNDRGWGKPVQAIELEGHIQNQIALHGVVQEVSTAELSLAQKKALREILRPALPSPGQSGQGEATSDIIEAEFSDTTSKE